VPTLYDGNAKLFQSLAILEYLEEKYPSPPILPKDLLARAWVRGFALINAADSHPLIVPRIRNYLTNVRKVDEAGRAAWIQHCLAPGCRRWRICSRRRTRPTSSATASLGFVPVNRHFCALPARARPCGRTYCYGDMHRAGRYLQCRG